MTDPEVSQAGDLDAAVSEDGLLNGKVRLLQPKEGYRVAIATVFRAAAVPAGPGDLVLDVGAGVGAASLCLGWRERGCHVRGLEVQRDLVRLAAQNVALNGMTGRVEVMMGDLLRPPPRLAPGSFAHIIANPPYLQAGQAQRSPNAVKSIANVEGDAALGDWIRFCLLMVRPKGTVTFIYRPDRMESLLAEFRGRAADIAIFPLWPGGNKPASRIIVRARKGVEGPTRLLTGMVLHRPDGRFADGAQKVLREGAGLLI
jgi:tRNA1(Val) A37 N6-methylase TrmN6